MRVRGAKFGATCPEPDSEDTEMIFVLPELKQSGIHFSPVQFRQCYKVMNGLDKHHHQPAYCSNALDAETSGLCAMPGWTHI